MTAFDHKRRSRGKLINQDYLEVLVDKINIAFKILFSLRTSRRKCESWWECEKAVDNFITRPENVSTYVKNTRNESRHDDTDNEGEGTLQNRTIILSHLIVTQLD